MGLGFLLWYQCSGCWFTQVPTTTLEAFSGWVFTSVGHDPDNQLSSGLARSITLQSCIDFLKT
jgi:hypothetical protein